MGSLCPSLPRVLSPAAPLSVPPGVHLKSFSLRSLLSAPILDSLASWLKEPLGSPSALACGTGVKLRPPHPSPAALEKKGSLSNPTWSLWGALSPHSPASPALFSGSRSGLGLSPPGGLALGPGWGRMCDGL